MWLDLSRPVFSSSPAAGAWSRSFLTPSMNGSKMFPAYCSTDPMTQSDLAGEAMFFDMLACAQDDHVAPFSPPLK